MSQKSFPEDQETGTILLLLSETLIHPGTRNHKRPRHSRPTRRVGTVSTNSPSEYRGGMGPEDPGPFPVQLFSFGHRKRERKTLGIVSGPVCLPQTVLLYSDVT